MGMTLADIKVQEEKLKKEQAKLRQQKKRLIEKENAAMGKALRKRFGFESFADFERWLSSISDDQQHEKQWIMSGLLMKNQRQANEIIPMNLTTYSE